MYRFLSVPAIIFALCISAAATEPQLVSVSPSSGSGASQTFTFTVSDSAGVPDIGSIDILFNSTFNGSTGCWISDQSVARFTLYNNGQWIGPAQDGFTLTSPVCTVTMSATNVSGNSVSILFFIQFPASFAGSKTIWMAAEDNEGNGTGYQPMGSYSVSSAGEPEGTGVGPSASTMNQNTTQTFNYFASDSAGVTELQGIDILFNDGTSNPYACWMWYERSTNTVNMYNQGSWSSPAPVGSGGTVLTGDSCTVDTSKGTVTTSGNQLTLSLPFTPTSGDGTAWPIYMNAISNANNTTGYTKEGTVTVNPN